MISMPAAIVLIVCKTAIAGPSDGNAAYTKVEGREWAIENSMMVCRRQVIPIHDTAADMGAKPITPNLFDRGTCARIGLPIGVEWDQQHKGSAYRFWRVGCPTPIVDLRSGRIVGYKMPECGHRDTVRCEVDAEI
ncbi:MAG: hypothetical protein ACOYB4_05325 [Methyloceanibacter sp.]